MLPEDTIEKPAPAKIVGINNATVAQLDALARPVHPSKVEIQSGLDDAEDHRDRLRRVVVGIETAQNPVQQVQATVRTQEHNVKRRDDGGHGCLAEEQQLGENAHRLEDLGEIP